MTKRYSYYKSEITGLFVIFDEKHRDTFSGIDDEYNCSRIVRKLNTLTEENGQLKKEIGKQQEEIEILSEENEKLKKENKELRQDNDIKFWKLQCIQSLNNNQVMLFELSRVIQQGYEVSDKFKQYLDEIKEQDKKIREKHKRLFE